MNPFVEFLARYGPEAGEEGPVRFACEVMGATLEPGQKNSLDQWQQETLRAYGRGERGITIRACHGPGKTWVAAVMVWHSLCCRFPQNTVVTAPSIGQLEGALVKEVLTMFIKLPQALQDLFEVTKNKVVLKASPSESFFIARTAREEKPEALQGIHCDAGYVLLIADEASGVPEKVFEAAVGSMSGHRVTTVLLSNPTRTSGLFFDSHTRLDGWFRVHVRHSDSSRVSEEFVSDVAARYGRESNAFRVRALGEFPRSDLDTIIPYELVESARERDIVVPQDLTEVWGLDVARYGDDACALVRRNRLAVMPSIDVWQGLDTMQTAQRVKAHYDACPPHARPEEILVDEIGLGAGVLDRLRMLNLPARGINVGETASASEKYARLRTELWIRGRDWLATRNHKLPREACCGKSSAAEDACAHDKLAAELVVPKLEFDEGGRMKAESKKDMKKRGFKSPNIADAFLLTFGGEPSRMMHGTASDNSGWNMGWNAKLSRDLSHV